MQEMVKIYKHLVFTWIDCDKLTDLVEKHDVDTVPTVLVFHPHKSDVDKIVNPSPETLNEEIEKLNVYYKTTLQNEKERVFNEIEVILGSFPMVCFIKGTPTEPKCKFTRRLLGYINKYDLIFKHVNIFDEPRIRQWLKVYSDWQTYPQVYINKEFVGGIDIVDELVEGDEFLDMVPKECKKLPPIEIFEMMLESFEVVILIEGTPDKPLSETSKSIVKSLDDNCIKYVTVDYIALEQQVQDHIKAKHAVSECPYIFIKKAPFGNEQALLKVINDGTVENVISEGSRKISLNDRLKKLISKFDAMLLFTKYYNILACLCTCGSAIDFIM
jgi:glutaredoxin-related protein